MAITEGWRGSAYMGSVKIAELNHFRANLSGGIVQKTSFGNQTHTRAYTVKDVDGDISGNLDKTNATGQFALIDMFLSGGTMADVFLYLYLSGTYGIYGNALVTPSINVDAGGLDGFDCGFVADGDWDIGDLA